MTSASLPLESKELLEQQYLRCRPGYEGVMNTLVRDLRSSLAEEGLSVTLRHRIKQFPSWYAKVLRNAAAVGDAKTDRVLITDVLGIRIVCPFLEEVELVSGLLEQLYTIHEFEKKGADYPAYHFGYESVHFLIRLPGEYLSETALPEDFKKNPFCEVQVRTILQEAWAEVEHELVYKSDFSPLDEPLKRKLAALNANLTLSDIMFQEIRDYQKELHTALRQRRTDFYNRLRQETGEGSILKESADPSDILAHARDTVDDLLLKGLLLHNAGRFQEAVAIYTTILERDVRKDIQSVILTHRGMAYFSGGMSAEALEDFNRAVELDPLYTKARYYRAVHSRTVGDFQAAFRDLEECLRLAPFDPEFLTARAETFASEGNPKAARDDCMAVLRLEPAFKPALRLLKELESPGFF
ncbi:MAG: (p)ppGpp synthetase [Spirochaetales bacterium]|nr:(p)ppGpp synthetase [Spirochaetales bacterium]